MGSILWRRGGSWVLFCAVMGGPRFYSAPSWGFLGSILRRRGGFWVLFCAVVGGSGFYSAPSWGVLGSILGPGFYSAP
jgi:hypothetical protein